MCVKSFFGILVILTSMFCVSCQTSVERAHTQSIKEAKQRQKPKPQPKPFKQGFLVKWNLAEKLGLSSAKKLDGASVCLLTGSKEEKLVSDYFKKNGMAYEVVTVENKNEKILMIEAGRCDVMVIFSNANVSSDYKVLPFE